MLSWDGRVSDARFWFGRQFVGITSFFDNAALRAVSAKEPLARCGVANKPAWHFSLRAKFHYDFRNPRIIYPERIGETHMTYTPPAEQD